MSIDIDKIVNKVEKENLNTIKKESENKNISDSNLNDKEIKEKDEDENTKNSLVKHDNNEKDFSIDNLNDDALNGIKNKLKSGEMDFNEASKEFFHVGATINAVNINDPTNDGFNQKAKKLKQDELKASLEKTKLEEEAKKLEARQKRNEAFYNAFRPVLEFDFGNLIPEPKEKDKNIKVQNIETKDNSKINVTKSKSYSIPLMILLLALFIAPYCLVSMALAIFNGINSLFIAVSRFTKPAFWLCAGVAGCAIIVLLIYVVILAIQGIFAVQILPV